MNDPVVPEYVGGQLPRKQLVSQADQPDSLMSLALADQRGKATPSEETQSSSEETHSSNSSNKQKQKPAPPK